MEYNFLEENTPYTEVTAALKAAELSIIDTCMQSIKNNGEFNALNMYGWGIARRAVALSNGYRTMVEQRNSLCALPIVRMQLDTALRLYAGFFAPDRHAFCTAVIGGEQVDRLKSDDGQKMRDKYLLERVSTKNPWMLKVYKLTSGYIHFSGNHIQEVFRTSEKDNELKIVIGPDDFDRDPSNFHEPSRCMHHLNMIIDCALDDWFCKSKFC